MEFTKHEEELLAEAEKYSAKTWHDILGWVVFLLLSLAGILRIIGGMIDVYDHNGGLEAISVGCMQVGFGILFYGWYRSRKHSLLLIQKLHSLKRTSEE